MSKKVERDRPKKRELMTLLSDLEAKYTSFHYVSEKYVALITPKIAEQLLSFNTNNFRALSAVRVRDLAEDIRNGDFDSNGATLVFNSRTGALDDGQHRLAGCVASGKSFKTYIVLSKSSTDNLDVGCRRNYTQILYNRGFKSAGDLASILRVSLKIKNGTMRSASSTAATHASLDRELAQYPEISADLAVCRQVRPICTPARLAPLFRFFREKDAEMAQQFIEAIINPETLSADDPVIALRRALEREHRLSKSGLDRTVECALIVKAWNAWRKGVPLRQLGYRMVGVNAEEFPEII